MNLRRFLLIFGLWLIPLSAFGQLNTTQITSQATTCGPASNSSCLIVPLPASSNTVGATLSGTFSGTLQFEGSGDGEVTWVSVAATPSSGGSSVTSATAAGTWQIAGGGYTHLRIRCSTYTSGTVIATLNPSKAVAAVGAASGGGGSGTVSPGTTHGLAVYSAATTVSSASDASANINYLAVNALTANALTCGTLNTTACVITGYSSTSGTATLTWPAVAGTASNPVASSNYMSFPNGASGSPSITFTGDHTAGLWNNGSGSVLIVSDSGQPIYFQSGTTTTANIDSGGSLNLTANVKIPDGQVLYWSGANLFLGHSGGLLTVGLTGSGTATTGAVAAAGYMSEGTKFTTSGGLGESSSTTTGGATAGKFTTATSTTGSTVVTMGNSATAPNGWHCSASDITHPLDIIIGTSASTTTATLTVAVAITASDVIEFSCVGY